MTDNDDTVSSGDDEEERGALDRIVNVVLELLGLL
jgi:hypothetical protein